MAYKLNKKICPAGLKNNPNKKMAAVKYITIHTTGNTAATATASSHAGYQYNGSGGNQTSWHYTVDKDEVWQSFEDYSACWHAGDGAGDGNNVSLGIEICVNDKGGFVNACKITAELTADLLKRHGLAADRVKQHYDWTRKDCPRELRAGNWGINWAGFMALVTGFMGADSPPATGRLTAIAGGAQATVGQMAAYIRAKNAAVPGLVIDMLPLYLSEGAAEGIRGDIAFAQSCLETGNFTFAGSAVTPAQNNFCGLGVTANGVTGCAFEIPLLGIRAQIHHLKGYANNEPLNNTPSPDPRFNLVTRGSAPYIEWLGQKENPNGYGWATGAGYGGKILAILGAVLSMPDEPPVAVPSDWARTAWEWGKANGITDGTNPAAAPTREQVLQLLYNYHGRFGA